MTLLAQLAARAGLTEQEVAAITAGSLTTHPAATAVRHGYQRTDEPDAPAPGPVAGYDLGLALAARDADAPLMRMLTAPAVPLSVTTTVAIHERDGHWTLAHDRDPSGTTPDVFSTSDPRAVLERLSAVPTANLLLATPNVLDRLAAHHDPADQSLTDALALWSASARTAPYRAARPVLDLLAMLYQSPRQEEDLHGWALAFSITSQDALAVWMLNRMLAGQTLRTNPTSGVLSVRMIDAEAATMPPAVRSHLHADRLAARRHRWTGEVLVGPARSTRDPDRFVIAAVPACAYPVGATVQVDPSENGEPTLLRVKAVDARDDGLLDVTLVRDARTHPGPALGTTVTVRAPAVSFANALARADHLLNSPAPITSRAPKVELDWNTIVGAGEAQDRNTLDPEAAVAVAAYHLATGVRTLTIAGTHGAGKTETLVRLAAHLSNLGENRVGISTVDQTAAISAANRASEHGAPVRLLSGKARPGRPRAGGFVRRPEGLSLQVRTATTTDPALGAFVDVATDARWMEGVRPAPSILLIDDADDYTDTELQMLSERAPAVVLATSARPAPPEPDAPAPVVVELAPAPTPPTPHLVPASGWWSTPETVAAVVEAVSAEQSVVVVCPTQGLAARVAYAVPVRQGLRVQSASRPFESTPDVLVVVDPRLDAADSTPEPSASGWVRAWWSRAPQVVVVEPSTACPTV